MTRSADWPVRSMGRHDQQPPRWLGLLLRLMATHLALLGMVLLVGALALAGYLYSLDFKQVAFARGLRIVRPSDIYTRQTQLQVAGVVVLAGASLVQFWAVRQLERRRGSLIPVRLGALMLMGGVPAALALWTLSGTSATGDAGLVRRTLQDLALVVRAGAALLILQSGLALLYLLTSFTPPLHRRWRYTAPTVNPLRGRVVRLAVVLWTATLIALGLTLGVLTDWLYEVPVARPTPGQLLYVTSFEALNEEWDLFAGRDMAQVAALPAATGEAVPLAGEALQITYGSGRSDEIIWSTLDRKFNDFDLRVTAQLLDGPVDQNQFGVIFRYRNPDNFYMFLITADGYFSLQKVRAGVREKISDWGVSEAIRQGNAANVVRVVARDDTFRFYVNGVLMPLCLKGENMTSMWASWEGPGICYTDELRYVYQDSAFAQGRIALVAGSIDGSDVRVGFDDLVLVGPGPQSDAEPVSE